MRRIVRTGVFVAATAAVVIGGTLVAYAGWITPTSTASVKVKAGSMPKGVTPSAAIQSGKAVVSWSAQEIAPGVKMTSYVVTAHDTDATPLPNVARELTASGAATESATFTAAELAGGKWKFAIIPKLQTWIGTEGQLSSPKLVFAAPSPATALAAAVTAAAITGTNPPAVAPAPATTTPTAVETTTTPAVTTTDAPRPDPTTSAPGPAPEKTESPTVDPSPLGSSAAADSAAENSAS